MYDMICHKSIVQKKKTRRAGHDHSTMKNGHKSGLSWFSFSKRGNHDKYYGFKKNWVNILTSYCGMLHEAVNKPATFCKV